MGRLEDSVSVLRISQSPNPPIYQFLSPAGSDPDRDFASRRHAIAKPEAPQIRNVSRSP